MSKSIFGQLVSRIGIVMAALIAASLLPLSASAQTLTRAMPLPTEKFVLSVGGQQIVFGGLDAIQTQTPTQPVTDLKQPVAPPPSPSLTLMNGSSTSGLTYLSNWHQLVLNGSLTARKDADVFIYNSAGAIVLHYHLTGAWPSKLTTNILTATSPQLLYNVTLTAERMTTTVAP
jgi:T4-like virus tail tube protein gp19